MNIRVARRVRRDHAGVGIVLERSLLDVANDMIPAACGRDFRVFAEGSPSWLADAAEPQVGVAECLAEGHGDFRERVLIAGPHVECLVLALIVQHAAYAEMADGHDGGVEQSYRGAPAATGVAGLLGQPQPRLSWSPGVLFGFSLVLGEVLLVFD